MSTKFSSSSYRALLQAFADRDYKAISYADADPARRHLILRHDIDISLGAALPIAEVEHEAGMAATYFVMTRSEIYNPFAPDGARTLARIAELGHRIGLHFDAALYGAGQQLDDAAARECSVLEKILGQDVSVISFHRPAPTLVGRAGTIAGRRHAYEPRFFAAMGYCSDSRGGWHRGAPLDHPAVRAGMALQLLTHPIWWLDPAADPAERLDRFLDTKFATLDRELAEHCEVHLAGRRAVR
ncbi:MAG: hypothetical protein ACKVSF_12000 [Alphaproteobacteria bacterium]